MPAVLAAASYYRGGFSLCLAGSAKRVLVPGGSMFHLKPGTITSNANSLLLLVKVVAIKALVITRSSSLPTMVVPCYTFVVTTNTLGMWHDEYHMSLW